MRAVKSIPFGESIHSTVSFICCFIILYIACMYVYGCASTTLENYRYQTTISEMFKRLDDADETRAWEAADRIASTIVAEDKQWDKDFRTRLYSKDNSVLWKLHYIIDHAHIYRFQKDLLNILPDLDFPLKQYNMQLLSRSKSSKIRKAALQVIEGRDDRLIPAAITVLGTYGKDSDLERIGAYQHSGNRIARECLLDVLYQYWREKAIDQILGFLDDQDPRIMCKAINYLNTFEDERIRVRLLRFLATGERGLMFLGSEPMDNESAGISEHSGSAHDTVLNPWALSALGLRKYSVPEVINGLINALGYSDPSTREYAALSLGSMGTGLAVPNLLPLLQDESSMVRRAAVWSLGRLNQPIAIDYLKNVEKFDPEPLVREQARISLEEIKAAR